MAVTYTTVLCIVSDRSEEIGRVLAERREKVVRAIPDKVAALVADGMSEDEAVARLGDERAGGGPIPKGTAGDHERYVRMAPIRMALMTEATRDDAHVLLAALRPPEGDDAQWGLPATPRDAVKWWGVHQETRSSAIEFEHDEGLVKIRISTNRAAPMAAVEAFATEFPDAKVVGCWFDETYDDMAAFYSGADGTGIVDLEPSAFSRWYGEGRDDKELILRLVATAWGLKEYEEANPGYVRML